MKKKYLTLLLSAALCSSVFFTGCGMGTSESVSEEDEADEADEDDEDDKDEDDKDEDDDEDEKTVYVESIDEESLLGQIKVFVRNKKLWTISDGMSAVIENAGYCVTDLDHNGRAEIIVMTASAYSSVTDMRIFEITEKGDAFREAEIEYTGVEGVCSSQVPDLIYYPSSETYLDKKKQVSHYLTNNDFDNGNGNYGCCYCEMSYSDGILTVYTYASIEVGQSYDPDTMEYTYDYTYMSPDGETDEDELYDIITDYSENKDNEPVYFGIYYRGGYEDPGVMGLDDAFLAQMMADSYRVFTDEYDYADYYQKYNDPYAPGSSQDETYYEQYIGMWGLYSVEIEGDEQFYTPSSPQYSTLELTGDCRAIMTQYRDGEVSLRFECDVEMDEEMRPYFDYDDASALPEGFVNERYTIVGMNSDRDVITVYLDFYGEDGMLGGSTIKFLKDYE